MSKRTFYKFIRTRHVFITASVFIFAFVAVVHHILMPYSGYELPPVVYVCGFVCVLFCMM